MTLQEFLRAERGRGARLAKQVGVPPAYLSQMSTGRRPVPAELVPAIEVRSDMLVRRWELRPKDWHHIWPELIGTEGAPAIQPATPQENRDVA